MLTCCLVPKRISETEGLGLDFMGGRHLGEGWLVFCRWNRREMRMEQDLESRLYVRKD